MSVSKIFEVPTVPKRAYENFFVYVQFRRSDGNGWLASDEKITGTPTVTVKEKSTGVDTSTTMVDNITAHDDTICKHRLKGGEDKKTYVVDVRIATDKSQNFEYKYEVKVSEKP